jgi:hypothetical protein
MRTVSTTKILIKLKGISDSVDVYQSLSWLFLPFGAMVDVGG